MLHRANRDQDVFELCWVLILIKHRASVADQDNLYNRLNASVPEVLRKSQKGRGKFTGQPLSGPGFEGE